MTLPNRPGYQPKGREVDKAVRAVACRHAQWCL